MKTSLQILLEAREFLSNEDNWCPEGPDGGQGFGISGHKRCAIQAINQIADGIWPGELDRPRADALNMIRDASAGVWGRGSIIDVNRKGHKAVMAMFDRAIATATKDLVLVVSIAQLTA